HGDDLRAAAPALCGQRAGQREHRPQRGHQAEGGAGLPADRPAQRLDVDRERVAVHARQDGRQALDEVDQLLARLGRVVRLAEGGATGQQERADQAGHDDHGEARVAEGLGVDGAQPVDTAPRAGLGRHARRARLSDGGHDATASGLPSAAAASPSCPYWARNVSSRLGSRLTKSSRSERAAAWTTGVIGPETRSLRVWSWTLTSDTPGSAENAATGTVSVKRSSTW